MTPPTTDTARTSSRARPAGGGFNLPALVSTNPALSSSRARVTPPAATSSPQPGLFPLSGTRLSSVCPTIRARSDCAAAGGGQSAETVLSRAEPRQRGSVARPISDGENLPNRGVWWRRAEGALIFSGMVPERRPCGAVKYDCSLTLLNTSRRPRAGGPFQERPA